MIIELNIGLNVTNGDNSTHALISRHGRVLQFLRNSDYLSNVLDSRLARSNTEETVVVKLSVSSGAENRIRQELFELAVWLEQDCIAVYNATGWSGELVGPNAAAWGEFNPDYFIRFNETDGPAKIFTKKAESKVAYTGHGAKTGGLQGHSVGEEYPYIVMGVADRWEAPTEYVVMDSRTGNRSARFPTYMRAYIELTSLRVRNCMHG